MKGLANLARDMEQIALRSGFCYRDLPRGLSLQLHISQDGGRSLHLSRPATKPPEGEIALCRRLFGVPEGAQRTDGLTNVFLEWGYG